MVKVHFEADEAKKAELTTKLQTGNLEKYNFLKNLYNIFKYDFLYFE